MFAAANSASPLTSLKTDSLDCQTSLVVDEQVGVMDDVANRKQLVACVDDDAGSRKPIVRSSALRTGTSE
jgi:hypothetical protein